MRAALVDRYGGPEVAQVADIAAPTPRANEVLVRVEATAVTAGDARIRAARFPAGFGPAARLAMGILRPRRRVLGACFAGTVTEVGSAVTDLRPGAAVCGMTGGRFGTHAEVVAVVADRVVPRPESVSASDAAGVLFGGTTALHFLRQAAVGEGTSVLINGASGAVGTNGVQLARHLGADVTAVTSGRNAELVRGLGAGAVIDHTRVHLADVSDRFDVVMDFVGNLTIATGRRLLRPGGRLVLAVAGLGDMLRARGDVLAGTAPEQPADFAELLELVATGRLRVVLDGEFPLSDIASAYELVDSGRKVGNVIVRPDHGIPGGA